MIKVIQKKKKVFDFKKMKSATILFAEDPNCDTFKKEVTSMISLGDFGYHTYFKDKFSITHLSSGLRICSVSREKEARIILKRLYCSNDLDAWDPDPDCVIQYLQFKKMTWEIIRTHFKLPEDTGEFSIDNTEEDVPF